MLGVRCIPARIAHSSKDAINDRPDLCAEDGGEQESIDSERKVVVQMGLGFRV